MCAQNSGPLTQTEIFTCLPMHVQAEPQGHTIQSHIRIYNSVVVIAVWSENNSEI